MSYRDQFMNGGGVKVTPEPQTDFVNVDYVFLAAILSVVVLTVVLIVRIIKGVRRRFK
jgi:hypothetical protein